MRLFGSRVTRTKCSLNLPLLNQSSQSSPVLMLAAGVPATVSQEDAWGTIFKMRNSNWNRRASLLQRSMHTCSIPTVPAGLSMAKDSKIRLASQLASASPWSYPTRIEIDPEP